jgi:hypothetical protein
VYYDILSAPELNTSPCAWDSSPHWIIWVISMGESLSSPSSRWGCFPLEFRAVGLAGESKTTTTKKNISYLILRLLCVQSQSSFLNAVVRLCEKNCVEMTTYFCCSLEVAGSLNEPCVEKRTQRHVKFSGRTRRVNPKP